MKTINKTKKELINELVILRNRLSQLEVHSKTPQDLGRALCQYYPHSELMNYAMYVMFDWQYEFVNQKFAELFDATPEEICKPGFDPMLLIAPESREIVRENLRKGYRGDIVSELYEFTGRRLDGLAVKCETFVLFIPYKWGLAIHGMLRVINDDVRQNIMPTKHIPMGTMAANVS